MSVSNNASLSAKTLPDWLQNHPILIMSMVFLVGLLLGITGNSLITQQGAIRELSSIRAELHRSNRTIDRLTGFDKSVSGTNTLLEELHTQKQALVQAREDLKQMASVNRDLRQAESDLAGAGQRSANLLSLISDVNETTTLVRNAAKSSLTTLQDLQVMAIDQQFALPEIQSSLIAQSAINNDLKSLGGAQATSARSLEAIRANQDRLIDIAADFEEGIQQVDHLAELMDRQRSLQGAMHDFDEVLNTAEWLAADARQIQNRLDQQRAYHNETVQNLDDLVWMSQYLGMQTETIDKAQDSLAKIDDLQDETVRLERVLGDLVDVVELVTGVNSTLATVSHAAVEIRRDLAEIVLLQPVLKQMYAEMSRDLDAPESPQVTDARKRAEALISSRNASQTKEVSNSSTH